MDKFFNMEQNVPPLPAQKLEQMTELALSYRQLAPEPRKSGFLPLRWVGPLSACAAVVIAVFVLQTSSAVVKITPSATAMAETDDTYEDITDLALLQTLDSF